MLKYSVKLNNVVKICCKTKEFLWNYSVKLKTETIFYHNYSLSLTLMDFLWAFTRRLWVMEGRLGTFKAGLGAIWDSLGKFRDIYYCFTENLGTLRVDWRRLRMLWGRLWSIREVLGWIRIFWGRLRVIWRRLMTFKDV